MNEEDPEREEELYWDLILFEGPIQNLVQQLTEVERWESSTKFCTAGSEGTCLDAAARRGIGFALEDACRRAGMSEGDIADLQPK